MDGALCLNVKGADYLLTYFTYLHPNFWNVAVPRRSHLLSFRRNGGVADFPQDVSHYLNVKIL